MNEHIRIIGHIRTDFPTKFGIPRQGIVQELKGTVVLEPEFRNPNIFKGIEEFSHLWILWQFSANNSAKWSATVRPPRLGGKVKVGVFACRSPFRPSDIGMSCVKLESVEMTDEGPVLHVSGIDMMDMTPIYDIKPYVPLSDCIPEASEGFTARTKNEGLEVDFPDNLLEIFPEEKRKAAVRIIEEDPRPRYMPEDKQNYGVSFAGMDIHFKMENEKAVVYEVIPLDKLGPDNRVS